METSTTTKAEKLFLHSARLAHDDDEPLRQTFVHHQNDLVRRQRCADLRKQSDAFTPASANLQFARLSAHLQGFNRTNSPQQRDATAEPIAFATADLSRDERRGTSLAGRLVVTLLALREFRRFIRMRFPASTTTTNVAAAARLATEHLRSEMQRLARSTGEKRRTIRGAIELNQRKLFFQGEKM